MEKYEVRRSARRRRTVSVVRENGRIVAMVPATLTRAQEKELLPELVARFLAKESRTKAPAGDDDLQNLALELARTYFAGEPEIESRLRSVRWVSNQQKRWGSCTPSDGTIRLTDRLRGAPSWVVDSVLVHEIAHLAEPGHTPRFRSLVARYPEAERAEGFLAGLAYAWGLPPEPD